MRYPLYLLLIIGFTGCATFKRPVKPLSLAIGGVSTNRAPAKFEIQQRGNVIYIWRLRYGSRRR